MQKITVDTMRVSKHDNELWFTQGMDAIVINSAYINDVIKALDKLREV